MPDVLTTRRVIATLGVLVLSAVGWTAWLAWSTEKDLRRADDAVRSIRTALENGDDRARDQAVADLQEAAASADGRTDGVWWSALTKIPVYGDDAAGVEALSASVDIVARDAIRPLIETADDLDGLVVEGRIDPTRVEALRKPIGSAAEAMSRASSLVAAEEPAGFVDALRTRYQDYAEQIDDIAAGFGAAKTAVDVLPSMLGAEGPRDYLLIFQNNAEIRSTGGLPGSWARVHIEDGKLELREQGSASDLNASEAVAELTVEEEAFYGQQPAFFFQDPNFIPDFPRAAALFNAFWAREYPGIELDGVITMDTVAVSYLMEGTGPVTVNGQVLSSDNLVEELLSNTYIRIADPAAQDRRFRTVVRGVLNASTDTLVSPVDFIQGFARAANEGRFLIAPFDSGDATRLAGTRVLGQAPEDDGDAPQVGIGLNDTTGSKMSYYLRYSARVEPRSCVDGAQRLTGQITLNQNIAPRDAEALPPYVTGGAQYGIPVGSQLVAVRLYGPFGGSISNIRIDGEALSPGERLEVNGRPVAIVAPLLETTKDVIVTWEMVTGPGQTGTGDLRVTPSVVPGSSDRSFESAC